MSFQTSAYEGSATNGTPAATPSIVVQVQQPTTGPRAQKRVEWLSLAAEDGEYADHKIKARMRYPDRINQEFASGDFVRIRLALREVVLEHNGWLDPDTNEPLPPAQGEGSDGFWDTLAQEEILLMMRAVGNERKKVFSSLFETKSS